MPAQGRHDVKQVVDLQRCGVIRHDRATLNPFHFGVRFFAKHCGPHCTHRLSNGWQKYDKCTSDRAQAEDNKNIEYQIHSFLMGIVVPFYPMRLPTASLLTVDVWHGLYHCGIEGF